MPDKYILVGNERVGSDDPRWGKPDNLPRYECRRCYAASHSGIVQHAPDCPSLQDGAELLDYTPRPFLVDGETGAYHASFESAHCISRRLIREIGA